MVRARWKYYKFPNHLNTRFLHKIFNKRKYPRTDDKKNTHTQTSIRPGRPCNLSGFCFHVCTSELVAVCSAIATARRTTHSRKYCIILIEATTHSTKARPNKRIQYTLTLRFTHSLSLIRPPLFLILNALHRYIRSV